ncbi:MAG: UbiA prenyltransferase family protein [Bacteroidia bacterium]
MSRPSWILAWVRLLRPSHYVKNILIFSPMVFGREWGIWVETLSGFWLFCLLSSATYALNDVRDAEADRHHPDKRHRPVASGAVSPKEALGVAVALGVLSIGAGFFLKFAFGVVMALYLLNNLLYTFWLKRLALWDAFSIAGGFLLRVYGGAAIGDIRVSGYLFMTVFFLSLFLAFGKRRYELLLLPPADHKKARYALHQYSVYYLDQLMSISATLTLVVYVLYLMQGDFTWLMATLPVVVMGIFRYYHLTHNLQGGEPSRELLTDPVILVMGVIFSLLSLLETLQVPLFFK